MSLPGEDGLCFIETANLDGETNLKQRHAFTTMEHPFQPRGAEPLGVVTCEEPNNRIYEFTGFTEFRGATVALAPQHLLLRGCILRNTDEAIGLVLCVLT